IGYPVMLKAAAGGGGKGMRLAWDEKELDESLQAAINEAQNAFGDGRVFIEKFIEQPRHIEIQILGDQHGHIIYVGERECSLQRRHQKVLEEAPSAFIDDETRHEMGKQAIKLAQAVNYFSAGTVEFIVDRHKNFYFLEMNTRLQVEHPVSELVSGLDLVEWMIRIARGEKLSLQQSHIQTNGFALEARIYAEDPIRGFLPSIGRLKQLSAPAPATKKEYQIRVDTGVAEGSEISMHYDPMIAKLIVWAKTRELAFETMRKALNDYQLSGISSNIPFLSLLVCDPNIINGDADTGYIERHFTDTLKDQFNQINDLNPYLSLAAILWTQKTHHPNQSSIDLSVFKENIFTGERELFAVSIKSDGSIIINQKEIDFRLLHASPSAFSSLASIKYQGQIECFQYQWHDARLTLRWNGQEANLLVMPARFSSYFLRMKPYKPKDMSKFLLSSMPGTLIKIIVSEGQEVDANQPLAIVEAMKMENILRAPNQAIIKKIMVEQGDVLSVDQIILEYA
ncbi:MAG: biotin/lipoyl-containing protein, partial [Pseudomonadota bacterium]